MQQLECPIDFVKVDENKVRLTALWILVFGIVYLILPKIFIPTLLTIDFALRGFKLGRLSALNFWSEVVVSIFKIKPKPIDQGPKLFAAKIGMFICAATVLCMLCSFDVMAYILMSMLVTFAFLESIFGFCAGCHLYTLYKSVIK
jgi:hypothetical protein